ncbi:hypothetical protein PIB30_044140 [Stylosanthes scabra]|uniref:Uncharacterized protein n=1 Tax=Stylosanthes scabra TaxID=79078 RepID=A0ABU6UH38_9FABA|nr:hypothetical protein [Stylosanthes scabra]
MDMSQTTFHISNENPASTLYWVTNSTEEALRHHCSNVWAQTRQNSPWLKSTKEYVARIQESSTPSPMTLQRQLTKLSSKLYAKSSEKQKEVGPSSYQKSFKDITQRHTPP